MTASSMRAGVTADPDILAQFAAEWPHDSWSIGRYRSGTRWHAQVHGHGVCRFGSGNTPREAFDAAVAGFRAEYPDELTAKRKQLEKARADAERLERELAEVAA